MVKIDDGCDGDDDSEDDDDDADGPGFLRIAMVLIDNVMHSKEKCNLRLGNGLMSPASLKEILGSRTLVNMKIINRSKRCGNNF